jgi:HlyD family secretion protein
VELDRLEANDAAGSNVTVVSANQGAADMKRIIVALLFVIAVGIGAGAYYSTRTGAAPAVSTATVSRGSIVDTVSATGTLQAVKTVLVGTQVSGTVSWLGADFNSVVHKGQVIARLDASLLEAQREQSQAALSRVTADVDNSQVQLVDAQQKYARSQELAARGLLANSDFDAAKLAVDTAQAQLKSVQAQLVQARAALNQTLVNLQHAVIESPIDGIVIERSVDVGQTVAASLQSPTIFKIAADMTKMQVSASIDESDIGRIAPGQSVTFTVDAYPAEPFTGTMTQVRLQPTVVQNVTAYSAIIDVPNPELKLKPGMTATVSVEIARREDVVRIPAAALRFTPTAAVLTALGQVTPQASHADTREKRVWVYSDAGIMPLPVTLGLSDGQFTELVNGKITPGMAVVTSVSTTAAPTRTAASPSMFMPGGGMGGPGMPGGGAGSGRNRGAAAGR